LILMPGRQRKIVVEVEIVMLVIVVARKIGMVVAVVRHFDAEVFELFEKFINLLRFLIERGQFFHNFLVR